MTERGPINICKCLKRGCQEDGARQWCVFQAIGKEAKAETNARDVTAQREEELLSSAGDQALEQIDQRDCGLSLTGNIQQPYGHNSMQSAPG